MLDNKQFLALSFLPLAWAVSLPQIDLERQGSSDYGDSSSYFFEGSAMTDADRQGSFAYVDYSLYGEMDDEDNYDEDSFEQEFGLDPITDPEEKERREEALWENEEIVKEENEDYLSGKKTWFDKVNEFVFTLSVTHPTCLLKKSLTTWPPLHPT